MSISLAKRFFRNTVAGLTGPLRLLIIYRSLIKVLAKRDLTVRTSGTVLGGLWMLLQPTLQVFSFWFLLDFVLKVRFPGQVTFISYFLIGLLPWILISEALTRCMSVLSEFASLYQRSAFPIALLPLLPLAMSGLIYGLIYAILVPLLEGPVTALWTVAIVLTLLLWLLPLCYLCAVIGLFIRDAQQLLPFILTMIMYFTPILYLPQSLPEQLRPLLNLNPMADLMAVIHWILQGLPITAGNVLRPLLLWLFLLAPAWVLFRRTEPHMREAL